MSDRAQAEDLKRNFQQWLELQRDMQSALETRLHSQLEDEPPFLSRYRRRYEREFPAWTGRHLAPAALTERLLDADITLLGDFHSLSQSQRTALRILRRLIRRGWRPALALEMIPARDQGNIDDWLQGRIGEKRFLEGVERNAWWDFPWPPVHALLRLAKRHKLPVIGLNCDVNSAAGALRERDAKAATLLADFRAAHPERPLLVFFGDFHLADAHLPAALRRKLDEHGLPTKILRVFQNHEPLYWESLNWDGRSPEILELEGGDLCVQSATPLVKLQSYLYWLTFHEYSRSDERKEAVDPGLVQEDLSREVGLALKRIARYLSIPLLEQNPPRVFWIGDADFARRIARESGWTPDELAQVQSALTHGDDSYLPGRDLAVLVEPGQNRIAEMAARVLHGRSTRISNRPRSLSDDFYLRVMRHALVFLASKLINPLRRNRDKTYLLRFLSEKQGEDVDWRARAELTLAYLHAEERFLERGDPSGFEARFFQLEPHQHLALTRAVGRSLGARLHRALLSSRISRFWLRELYFNPFHLDGSPARCYFDCLEKLGAWDEALETQERL